MYDYKLKAENERNPTLRNEWVTKLNKQRSR